MNKSKMRIDPAGNKFWRNPQGDLHNEDGPAFILINGTKAWYIHGKFYRENGPAVYSPQNTDKKFYIDDVLFF